jgi:hypothetical protein
MITYFVQVNVCWLLFYGAYFALLSRETFFRLNRYWLIISLLGGLLLPWIAPTLEVVEPTNVAAVMLQPFVVTAEDLSQNLQNTEGSLFKILAAIYGLGLAVTLGKLLFGFWKIKRLLNRADRLPMDDFTLMQVREAITPFSFFRWVFINLNLIQPTDLQQIILHERAHVRERHSIDVLFAEALGVVFWWSPLVYFYKKSLKNVHEYAADAAVLRTSSAPQYGRLLLRQQQSGTSLSLTNPFFSQLKKRILMMTRNPSKRRALAKYALAVPIFLVLTLLLASPKTKVMATTEAATERVVASIETFEKNLTAPQSADNELIMPNYLASVFNDTSITDNQERVFTLDANTPSSEWVMSVQEIRAMKRFTDKGTLFSQYGTIKEAEAMNLTITRISKKAGTTKVSNNIGAGFTKEMADLLEKAEVGDTYQFKSQAKVIGETKVQDFPTFTFFIGENPTEFKAEPLSAQQKAELVKISESPVVLLAGKRGGVIAQANLTQQDKLEAYQVVNGKTVAVDIQSFVMFRIERGGKSTQSNNAGGTFSEATKRLVDMAEIGDSYQFMHVKCRIKGETMAVDAGSMAFVVKTITVDNSPFVVSIADNIKVTLAGRRGGVIGFEELIKQDKLEAVRMVNGQNVPVEIESFILFRVPGDREKDPQQSNNSTGQFNRETKSILSQTKTNDHLQFVDVKCRVNGETVTLHKLDAPTMGFVVKGKTPQYNAPKDSSDPVFTIVEQNPEYVGGMDSMFRFLGRNIKYPAEAREGKVEGTVYIGFIVEKDGSLTNVNIKRNVKASETRVDTIQQFLPETGKTVTKIVHFQDESCAEEAKRVVQLMPKWKPGRQNGIPMRVAFTIPIKFKLE